MNKPDLAIKIQERMGLSELKSKECVDVICELMAKTLQSHERIEVRGFFSFSIRLRKAGLARDPKKGTYTPFSIYHYVHGKQSVSWRRSMNGGDLTSKGKY